MTEWYYSDAQRTQHGPVDAGDLAAMHTKGLLSPETLVWREGMSDWKPWSEMIREVIVGDAPDDPRAEALVKAAEAAPDDGAYRPYAIAEPSPYAPPQARVDENSIVVAGGRVVYAGLWKRFAASCIDSLVTTVASYALLIPIGLVLGVGAGLTGNSSDPFASGASIAFVGGVYLILITVPAIYFGWMHASSHQASLGKMAVGIKVVRTDGQPVSFWRSFLRYVAYFLFTLVTCGLGVLISGLMAALTLRKQALHDMMCDTLVVDKHAFTDHPEWQREELGTVTIVILSLVALLVVGAIALYAVMGAMMLGGMR